MQYSIDPTFSVYALVERTQKQAQTSAMYNRRTMSVVSNEIENSTIIDGAPNRIFSSFQFMSKFLPQVSRYQKIAERAESVYVFGVMDVDNLPQIPNLHYVPLQPTDQLAREWFLVSYSKTFATVLATEETSDFRNTPDYLRQFKGMWSFDVNLGHIVQEWLTSTVDAKSLIVSEADHDKRTQRILVNNIMKRMTDRVAQRKGGNMVETQEQLRIVIQNVLNPAIAV